MISSLGNWSTQYALPIGGVNFTDRQGSMSSIKRHVKKQVPPRPESRFVSRDPAHCSFGSLGEVGPFVHTHRFCADRGVLSSLRERQASVVECVNHGSIRGSWAMTISGYPRGHNV